MIDTEETTDVDAPPKEVFDYLADPTNHVEFTPSLTDVSDVEDADVGKRGSYTFEMAGVSLNGTFEDVAFDRPNRREYELDGGFEGAITWEIEGRDGGSRVRYAASLDMPGPDVLDVITDRVAKRMLQREARSTLENLKLVLEEQRVEAE